MQYNDYLKIKIKQEDNNKDNLVISFEKDIFNLYESKYNLSFLKNFILFKEAIYPNDIINKFELLLGQKEIHIEQFKKDIKLIFTNKEELILKKKYNLPEKTIQLLIDKYNYLTEENKEIKNQFHLDMQDIIKLKNELQQKENIIKEKDKIIKQKDLKINQLNIKIKELEENTNEKKISYKNNNIKYIKKLEFDRIILEYKAVTSMAIFPSGNLIIALESYPIKIYDKNYNEIQNIKGEKEKIYRDYNYIRIDIKDENNFCSCEKAFIKTWIKKNNIFIINHIVEQVSHSLGYKIEYLYNNLLITCQDSNNTYIKIWNEDFNNITLITKLNIKNFNTFLVLKDKNKLVISTKDNIEIRNLKNLKLIKSFNNIKSRNYVVLTRLDKDKIIIANLTNTDDYYYYNYSTCFLLIIDISEEKIIDKISTNEKWDVLYPLKNKNILLVAHDGCKKALAVKKDDFYIDYKFNPIKFHDEFIEGFIELPNDKFAIFGSDGTIKIFKIS